MSSTLPNIFEAKWEILFSCYNVMQLKVIQQFWVKF